MAKLTGKRTVVRGLEWASSHRVYRRTAAVVFRRNPRSLYIFTHVSIMRPLQRPEEFVPFLKLLMRERPSAVLEIGTARGGTFFMMCQAAATDARLATLDLQLPSADLVRSFGRPRQTVVPLEGDSQDPGVRARVASLFPDGLDLLFIDGDHSLDGVTADFQSYEPLVRPGGLVVFHDIVEDNLQRTGVSTGGLGGWRTAILEGVQGALGEHLGDPGVCSILGTRRPRHRGRREAAPLDARETLTRFPHT